MVCLFRICVKLCPGAKAEARPGRHDRKYRSEMRRTMKFIKDILKGVVIGVANAIPGVSGGTMMVSMGVYDDIIFCVTHIFKQLKKSVMILLPYVIGMAVGIVGLAYAIEWLMAPEHIPMQTSLVFIGLILGGIPAIWQHLKGKKMGISHGLVFLVFFLAIIAMEAFGGSGKDVVLSANPVMLIKLFGVGVIASATMVIPGVSGSMMLMIMGYYNPVLHAIKDIVSALKDGQWGVFLENCIPMIPFGLGVLLGIFAIAKVIEFLLEKAEGITYCAIMGLVIASPVVILMRAYKDGYAGDFTPGKILTCLIALAVGTAIALLLGKPDPQESEQ